MKTITQLEDYHNEIENQRIQKALFEATCHESEVVYCFSLNYYPPMNVFPLRGGGGCVRATQGTLTTL